MPAPFWAFRFSATNEFFMPQVCKYWNVLALDGSSWQKINLFDFQRDIEVSVGHLMVRD